MWKCCVLPIAALARGGYQTRVPVMKSTYSVVYKGPKTLFGNFPETQIPFALARGLTKIGQRVQDATVSNMPRVFDRPTRFTLNSLKLVRAEKRDENPRAVVWFKDAAGLTSAPPSLPNLRHYVLPQVYGGSRPLKRLETRLRQAGVLAPGQWALPGRGARLDAHGNMSRGEIVALLSNMGGFGDVGGVKNTTAKRRAQLKAANVEYFAVQTRRGGLPPGLYKRVGKKAVVQVLRFIDRAPQYRPIFDFYGDADKVATQVADAIMRESMALALSTRKG